MTPPLAETSGSPRLEDEYVTVIAMSSGDRFGTNLPVAGVIEQLRVGTLVTGYTEDGKKARLNPRAIAWMVDTT